MKKAVFLTLYLAVAQLGMAQGIPSAARGVTYGIAPVAEGAVSVNDLEKKMSGNMFQGKISGKVTDVCLEKGCWMKLERNGGEKVMVHFKDYGFFMPKNIVGKDVVLDGEARMTEVSVAELQHYAADAGKSKRAIRKIKQPKKELQFIASGVLVQ